MRAELRRLKRALEARDRALEEIDAAILACRAAEPRVTLREIGETLGATKQAADEAIKRAEARKPRSS